MKYLVLAIAAVIYVRGSILYLKAIRLNEETLKISRMTGLSGIQKLHAVAYQEGWNDCMDPK